MTSVVVSGQRSVWRPLWMIQVTLLFAVRVLCADHVKPHTGPALMSPRRYEHFSLCCSAWLHVFSLRWQLIISSRRLESDDGIWPWHTHISFPRWLWHLSVTQQHGQCFHMSTTSAFRVRAKHGEYTAVGRYCDKSQGQGCWFCLISFIFSSCSAPWLHFQLEKIGDQN